MSISSRMAEDIFYKIGQGGAAFLGDVVEGGVVKLLRADEMGIGQLEEGLLEGEIVGVFLVQDEFGELGVA